MPILDTIQICRNNSQGLGFSKNPDCEGFSMALLGDEIILDPLQNHGYHILTPSKDRVKPGCPHFGTCGGCLWQHRSDVANAKAKTDYLVKLMDGLGQTYQLEPVITSPPQQRRRLGLHARKIGKKIELGFKARKSWDLVPIDSCLIAMPTLMKLKPVLIEMAKCLFNSPKSAPCFHLTVTQTGIDVEISGVDQNKSKIIDLNLNQHLIEASAGSEIARITLGRELVIEYRQPIISIGEVPVVLPYASFLQASEWAETVMQRRVMDLLSASPIKRVADLFSGMGTFALPVAQSYNCHAFDSDKGAINALLNARKHRQSKYSLEAFSRDLFRIPLRYDELKDFDAVIFDPPRAGAMAQSIELANSKIPLIIAISCNPQSFIRDAKILIDKGYKLKTVQPIDQFLWSSHLELIASFELGL